MGVGVQLLNLSLKTDGQTNVIRVHSCYVLRINKFQTGFQLASETYATAVDHLDVETIVASSNSRRAIGGTTV
jgi:hypothetical protein